MKRTFSFLMVLVLMLCCMSSALAATGSIKITASQADNGDTYVRWTDSGGPYKVTYAMSGANCSYTAESSTYGTATLLEYLAPDVTYTITVTDLSSNTKSSISYTVPFSIYREFKTGNQYLKLTKDSFSLSNVKANPLDTFELRTYWPRLRYDREYKGKLVLETPLGPCSATRVWQSFTLENQYAYNYNVYSLYTDFLTNVEDDYGTIPTGKYTFKMYFDGDLYDYVSFTLRK